MLLVSYSEIYRALVPGEQSQYRDQAVGDTGAPRAVGSVFDWTVGALAARELGGYIATPSPGEPFNWPTVSRLQYGT